MTIGSNYHVSKITWDPWIKLGNNTLDKVKSSKSLGVYISDTLSWSEHTDFVVKKVSNSIGGLKRGRPYVPAKTLETIYKSLIQPHFDYCDIVWSNLNVSQSLRLRKLQNRAARVILSANYDARSADFLESLQWDNLSQRRDKRMALLMCKTLQNKTPNYLRNMFSFANTGSGYDTRQRERKLALPKPRTDYLKKSFQYRGSRLCNPLPYDLRDLNKGSPIPFPITESRKIIWPFHASRGIQNKISRSRKSQNSNSRGHKLDLYQESRITET